MKSKLKVYFAGALFNHKDLIGNLLLANKITECSSGHYTVVLPQDIEVQDYRAKSIRDNDLKAVIDADMLILNFDGSELDSGTVVEYIFAKYLDKPTVVLRTDFRSGGDQVEGEPWNLMCSFFPRNKVILIDAMKYYKEYMDNDLSIEQFYEKMALEVVKSLDEVLEIKPLLPKDSKNEEFLREWAYKFAGIE